MVRDDVKWVVACVVTVGAVYLFLKARWKPDSPIIRSKTPPWIWVFLIAVIALVSYLLTGRDPANGQHRSLSTTTLVLLWLGGALGFFALLIGYAYYRNYDHAALRAIKKARAGDIDGAIADMTLAMEDRRPSVIRSQAMGQFLMEKKDWPGAYRFFLDAEKLAPGQAYNLNNLSMALYQMGRLEEAISTLRTVCKLMPGNPLFPCSLGLVLVDVGRFDEAAELLAEAETKYRKWIAIPASGKAPIAKQIEDLRKKLKGNPEARGQSVF